MSITAGLPDTSLAPSLDLPASDLSRWRSVWLVVLLVALGLGVRVLAFSATTSIRVPAGLDNAWSIGSQAVRLGKGDLCRGIVAAYDPANHVAIDYPPMRMYIKTLWVRFTLSGGQSPGKIGSAATRFDSILWPLLVVNAAMELAAAAGMYALCRRRYALREALLVACLLWFNPSAILNSFCWPQWDVWLLGPLLWSTYFLLAPAATRRFWPAFLGGVGLALAAALKGQALFAALPLLALAAGRPLLCGPNLPGRFRRAGLAAASFLVGGASAAFVITLPFTLRGSTHWLDIYTAQFRQPLPLTIDAWNLPYALQELLGAHAGTLLLGALEAGFVLWCGYALWRALRRGDIANAILLPGVVFAAMFALMPCMHERYALWAAVLCAPVVLYRSLPLTLAYSLINIVAVVCPLHWCLRQNPETLPALARWLGTLSPGLGLVWFLAAGVLSLGLLQTPPPQTA